MAYITSIDRLPRPGAVVTKVVLSDTGDNIAEIFFETPNGKTDETSVTVHTQFYEQPEKRCCDKQCDCKKDGDSLASPRWPPPQIIKEGDEKTQVD